MRTRLELKLKALHYIEITYGDLIAEIAAAMDKAAESGKQCLCRYPVKDEDEARSMERYFKAKDFDTESSWSSYDRGTSEYNGWYVTIFWW